MEGSQGIAGYACEDFCPRADDKNCFALLSLPRAVAGLTHTSQVLLPGQPPPSLSPAAGTALLNCSGLQMAMLLAG